MGKSVLVPIADGTEEMEVVIIVDILRRAGADVILAGLSDSVICSRYVKIVPDLILDDLKDDAKFDMIAIAGGLKGVENFCESDKLKSIILNNKNDAIIGAICAATLVLDKFGLIYSDTIVTSHPSVRDKILSGKYSEDDVVVSGNIISSRGAGTAFDFALKLVEILYDSTVSDSIASAIVYRRF